MPWDRETRPGRPAQAVPTVLTLGRSTRSAEELLALLGEHGIRLLVDVRRFPSSRRHRYFAKEALQASLAGAGIDYRHEPDLGGRRAARPDSPHVAWRTAGFRGYADHMETKAFEEALERVSASAGEGPVAILCAEAVPWRCHRQLIADALLVRGVSVRHILGPGRSEGHVLNSTARTTPEGRLVYDVPPPQRGLFGRE